MSIVITLVALFANFILPNLFGARQSQRERTFLSETKGVVAHARETAITTNQTLDLSLSGSRFSLTQESSDTRQKGDELLGLDMPGTITASRYQLNGQDSNQEDWLMHFYPDGTADAGGVEFTVGQITKALNVNEKAFPTLEDQLTNESAERWQAGTYEQR